MERCLCAQRDVHIYLRTFLLVMYVYDYTVYVHVDIDVDVSVCGYLHVYVCK